MYVLSQDVVVLFGSRRQFLFTYGIIEESQKVFNSCRALKFGTHEQELEPILVTNFQQKGPKSVSYMHTLSVSVVECVVVV